MKVGYIPDRIFFQKKKSDRIFNVTPHIVRDAAFRGSRVDTKVGYMRQEFM